jgi:type I restriction enzyme, S subunit
MHFINSPAFRRDVAGMQAGSTRKRISRKNLATVRLALPPTREQGAIADAVDEYLSRLEAAGAGLERAQANLKRYRASVLKAAVEGRLVPTEAELARKEGRDYEPASVLLERILKERRCWEKSEVAKLKAGGKVLRNDSRESKYKEAAPADVRELPPLPDGWCWATVEQLASHQPRSIQSGPFGSNLRHSEFQASGRLVLGIDNVQDGYFSMGANHRISEGKYIELSKYGARPGDVLITVMATVGRCCVVPSDLEPAIITKHVYRITCDRELVDPRYLHLTLWGAPAVRSQIFGEVIGQTRPGLNGSILKRIAIPLPPRLEQERIVAVVHATISQVDRAVADVADAATRAERLRQGILKWAFAGKLVDQDTNDEPASALLERIQAERAAAPAKKKATRRRKEPTSS